MSACKCFQDEQNFLHERGVCYGTKEKEPCSCGGNEAKCDFYEEVRSRAAKPLTNADRIRAMTDEELARFVTREDLCELTCGSSIPCDGKCESKMLDWLRQEAGE